MRLAPGATIGILGGGQLGRMTALAAARLGYRCHVFAPEPDGPAVQVTDRATIAPYDDPAALARFAGAVDVVTIEFENLPLARPGRAGARQADAAGARGAGDLPGPGEGKDIPRGIGVPVDALLARARRRASSPGRCARMGGGPC